MSNLFHLTRSGSKSFDCYSMVTLHFTYHEIIDTDWTAVDIVLLERDVPTMTFCNYDRAALIKEIYANQTETFQLPDRATALAMLRSNAHYRECAVEPAIT